MVVNQGDIYWIDYEEPSGSEPGYRHPPVVNQRDFQGADQFGIQVVTAKEFLQIIGESR